MFCMLYSSDFKQREAKRLIMRIRLIEYKCITNDMGQPFGHAEKAIEDAKRICINLGYEVEVAAASSYKSASIILPNSLKAREYTYGNINRILHNLRMATRGDKETIFWFVNIDWYLFLFLDLHDVKNKVIATVYKDRYDLIKGFQGKKGIVGKVLYGMLDKGMKKVGVFIETFHSASRSADAVYVPDYVYTDLYKSYWSNEKIARVVCPGTINLQKDIVGLVKVFNTIGYPLLVIGEFADSDCYEQVMTIKKENITVDNRRLEYDEYYKVIAESAYCITPYDMEKYTSATSGVIRESVYLNTIVIAPTRLLDNTGLNGIGYESLADLEEFFTSDKLEKKVKNDLEPYREESVMKHIEEAFARLT